MACEHCGLSRDECLGGGWCGPSEPFFVRPIVDTLEEWDALLRRQIAERYGVPVQQVQVLRDCGGRLSIHVNATKPEDVVAFITCYGTCQ